MSIRPTIFAKYEYDGLNCRVKKHIDTGGARGPCASAGRKRNAENGHCREYHKRDWGRALEKMKGDISLPNNWHSGRILDTGDVLDDAGKTLGNLADYLQ